MDQEDKEHKELTTRELRAIQEREGDQSAGFFKTLFSESFELVIWLLIFYVFVQFTGQYWLPKDWGLFFDFIAQYLGLSSAKPT